MKPTVTNPQHNMPESFPEGLIRPRHGSLDLSGEQPSVSIELEPFTIDEERVEKCLDFELEIPTCDLTQLVGRAFEFPSNPEDCYVESSIYIWGVHNPIDLHSISFAASDENAVHAEMDMTFVFEFEGDRENLRMKFSVKLDVQTD